MLSSAKPKLFFAPRVGRVRNLSMSSTWIALILICLYIAKTFTLSTSFFAMTTTLIAIGVINLIFLHIRRLNDVGWSGGWILAYIFLPLGIVIYLATFFMPSIPGSNKYGPHPVKITLWDYVLMACAPLVYMTWLLARA